VAKSASQGRSGSAAGGEKTAAEENRSKSLSVVEVGMKNAAFALAVGFRPESMSMQSPKRAIATVL